jgi:4-amino-4-deoxychorismate lyase
MSLLFETIKVQNGKLQNIELQNARLNKSRLELFGRTDCIDLREYITIPPSLSKGINKCKVVYSQTIKCVTFFPYTIRQIRTLQLVECNSISYDHKYVDRTAFDELKAKSSADEILIVKNGFITDTSFSNVVFFDGSKWITPSTTLLRGTKRKKLLLEGIITEERISVEDLCRFDKCALINSMMDLDTCPIIEMQDILG